MSRSIKKPFISMTRAGDLKEWKKMHSRKIRRKSIQEDLGDYSFHKRLTDPWGSPKEDKHYSNEEKSKRK